MHTPATMIAAPAVLRVTTIVATAVTVMMTATLTTTSAATASTMPTPIDTIVVTLTGTPPMPQRVLAIMPVMIASATAVPATVTELPQQHRRLHHGISRHVPDIAVTFLWQVTCMSHLCKRHISWVFETERAFGATCSGGGNTARFEGPTALSEGHTGTYSICPRTHGDLRHSRGFYGTFRLIVASCSLHVRYTFATCWLHCGYMLATCCLHLDELGQMLSELQDLPSHFRHISVTRPTAKRSRLKRSRLRRNTHVTRSSLKKPAQTPPKRSWLKRSQPNRNAHALIACRGARRACPSHTPHHSAKSCIHQIVTSESHVRCIWVSPRIHYRPLCTSCL